MIIDGNSSILDKINLNKGRFEGYIAVGLKKTEILSAFNVSKVDINNWCLEQYGLDFDVVFELLRQNTRAEYLDALKELGIRGNPTALSIVDRVINNENADDTNGVVFNVNVKLEGANDKEC